MSSVRIESHLRDGEGRYVRADRMRTPPGDPDYVEGYIHLVVHGTEVMGEEDWDLVDQLWAYIAQMLQEFVERGEARTHFPDQPTELVLRRQGDFTVITCDGNQAAAETTELLTALRDAGLRFVDEMDRLSPDESWRYTKVRTRLAELSLP